MDCFLQVVPPAECMAMGMRAPQTPMELIRALECALTTVEISKINISKAHQLHSRPSYSFTWVASKP